MAKKKKTQPEPDQNKRETDDNERRMERSDHEASAVQRATLPGCPKCGHRQQDSGAVPLQTTYQDYAGTAGGKEYRRIVRHLHACECCGQRFIERVYTQ
jgi:hypothetical protein